MYFDYRFRASKSNHDLRNRANAAELLGISESSLSNYETGKTKCVPPEMVDHMAKIYNAPELRNKYCMKSCPIGHHRQLATTEEPIEKIAVHLINCTNEKTLFDSVCMFTQIAESKIIDRNEQQKLKEIANSFCKISFALSEFFILAERQGVVSWTN